MADSWSFGRSRGSLHSRSLALALDIEVSRSPFGRTLVLFVVEVHPIFEWLAIRPDHFLGQKAFSLLGPFLRFGLLGRLSLGHVLGVVLAVIGGILILSTSTDSVTIPHGKGR